MPTAFRRMREEVYKTGTEGNSFNGKTRTYMAWSEKLHVRWIVFHNIELNTFRVDKRVYKWNSELSYRSDSVKQTTVLDYFTPDRDCMPYAEQDLFFKLPARIKTLIRTEAAALDSRYTSDGPDRRAGI